MFQHSKRMDYFSNLNRSIIKEVIANLLFNYHKMFIYECSINLCIWKNTQCFYYWFFVYMFKLFLHHIKNLFSQYVIRRFVKNIMFAFFILMEVMKILFKVNFDLAHYNDQIFRSEVWSVLINKCTEIKYW